jgi:hypothetical protein
VSNLGATRSLHHTLTTYAIGFYLALQSSRVSGVELPHLPHLPHRFLGKSRFLDRTKQNRSIFIATTERSVVVTNPELYST